MDDKKSLSEKYTNNKLVRGLVNLVPYAGGAIDTILSETGSKYRAERIDTLLSELDARISESTNSEELVKKISDSEEFYDLLVQSLNSALKTRHTEKIKYYSNILYNQLNSENSGSDISTELLITTLDSLTKQELDYLAAIKRSNQTEFHIILNKMVIWEKYKAILEKTGNEVQSSNNFSSEVLFDYNIEIVWKLLQDKNLIINHYIKESGQLSYVYSTSNMQSRNHVDYSDKRVIQLSDFGEYFVNWVMSHRN